MSLDQLISIAKVGWFLLGSATIVLTAIGILSGAFLVLWRLGKGLHGRKVGIFATGPHLETLKNVLTDSNLFKAKNIISIQTRPDLGRCEGCSVFVVYWADWEQSIDDVLRAKKDQTALIIYAPQAHGPIPRETMARLEQERNVIVTNFRGRLINDLITAMVASGYAKS